MREYPVPFSTREETPFLLGLTIREMLWIGGGLFTGLIFTFATFFVIGAKLEHLVLCLPITIPFTVLALYISRKKVEENDHTETMDRHLIKKVKYKLKPHKYLNYRQGD